MTYLVTLNPDTYYARTKVVADDMIDRVVRNSFPPYGKLLDGQAILIRRADYLDIKGGVAALSGETTGRFVTDAAKLEEVGRPIRHLTLIEGGKDGEQEGRDHGCQDPLCSCSV